MSILVLGSNLWTKLDPGTYSVSKKKSSLTIFRFSRRGGNGREGTERSVRGTRPARCRLSHAPPNQRETDQRGLAGATPTIFLILAESGRYLVGNNLRIIQTTQKSMTLSST